VGWPRGVRLLFENCCQDSALGWLDGRYCKSNDSGLLCTVQYAVSRWLEADFQPPGHCMIESGIMMPSATCAHVNLPQQMIYPMSGGLLELQPPPWCKIPMAWSVGKDRWDMTTRGLYNVSASVTLLMVTTGPPQCSIKLEMISFIKHVPIVHLLAHHSQNVKHDLPTFN